MTGRHRTKTAPGGGRKDASKSASAKKVLVVEDSDVIRRIISLILAGEGYEVLEADDGAAVVEIVRKMRPHVVTLDLSLKDVDGREVLRRLKMDEETKEVPVIILSAFTDALSPAERWYAADVITKPFDVDDLIARVQRVLN